MFLASSNSIICESACPIVDSGNPAYYIDDIENNVCVGSNSCLADSLYSLENVGINGYVLCEKRCTDQNKLYYYDVCA